jgi:hypothetical protein
MGRKMKLKEDRKVKFGISLSPKLFTQMSVDKVNKSKLIENLLLKYYENKNL